MKKIIQISFVCFLTWFLCITTGCMMNFPDDIQADPDYRLLFPKEVELDGRLLVVDSVKFHEDYVVNRVSTDKKSTIIFQGHVDNQVENGEFQAPVTLPDGSQKIATIEVSTDSYSNLTVKVDLPLEGSTLKSMTVGPCNSCYMVIKEK